ncbi:MAG: ATP-binding cassette domain-containing protein [Amaricoccus sp.]
MNVVECQDLGRSFGDLAAVEAVSFAMAEGEFLALLGPNGAGKSTLLNMLTTLIAPSRGEARVAGADVRREASQVRRSIGVVFQDPALDERLTARENLRIHAALYRLPRDEVAPAVTTALGWAQLSAAADRPVRTFSGGMKRRLELARADAPPTADRPRRADDRARRPGPPRPLGADRRAAPRGHVRPDDHARDPRGGGCSRVGIIDRGRLVAMGTPSDLLANALGRPLATLEDVFVELTGRGIRDLEASPRDRIVAFRRRGGEHTR